MGDLFLCGSLVHIYWCAKALAWRFVPSLCIGATWPVLWFVAFWWLWDRVLGFCKDTATLANICTPNGQVLYSGAGIISQSHEVGCMSLQTNLYVHISDAGYIYIYIYIHIYVNLEWTSHDVPIIDRCTECRTVAHQRLHQRVIDCCFLLYLIV